MTGDDDDEVDVQPTPRFEQVNSFAKSVETTAGFGNCKSARIEPMYATSVFLMRTSELFEESQEPTSATSAGSSTQVAHQSVFAPERSETDRNQTTLIFNQVPRNDGDGCSTAHSSATSSSTNSLSGDYFSCGEEDGLEDGLEQEGAASTAAHSIEDEVQSEHGVEEKGNPVANKIKVRASVAIREEADRASVAHIVETYAEHNTGSSNGSNNNSGSGSNSGSSGSRGESGSSAALSIPAAPAPTNVTDAEAAGGEGLEPTACIRQLKELLARRNYEISILQRRLREALEPKKNKTKRAKLVHNRIV